MGFYTGGFSLRGGFRRGEDGGRTGREGLRVWDLYHIAIGFGVS